MKSKLWSISAMLLAAIAVNASVIFQDDFSNPGISNQNWNASRSDLATISYAGGECTATNNSASEGVLLIHELDQNLSTFTFSVKIKKPEDKSAGFYFCLGTKGNSVVGYELLLFESNYIIIWKHKEGEPVKLFQGQSAYLTSGYNEIKLSKKTDKFNVFCNDQFTGSFTDSEYGSGNIALELWPKVTVKFDDVVLTDQFEEASIRTCFADDFSDGDLAGWFKQGNGQISFKNDTLMVTTSDAGCNLVTDLQLNNFVAKVTVSHRSGSVNTTYGFLLQGRSLENGDIPQSGFLITGKRMYGTFTSGTSSYTLYNSQKIRGAAYTDDGQTYYFYDTLEISKQATTGYIFKVNKSALCTIPEIGFEITNIGLFCSDSLSLLFDDFVAAEGTEAVCNLPIAVRENINSKKVVRITRVQPYIFDPLGRAIPNFSNIGLKRSLSPGIYIGADQKKMILKN
jgi:hypothetical protein